MSQKHHNQTLEHLYYQFESLHIDVGIIQDILNSYDDTIAKVDDDDGAKFDGVDVTADDAIIDGIDATADGTDATADGTDATADGTLDEHVPFADDRVEIKKENDDMGKNWIEMIATFFHKFVIDFCEIFSLIAFWNSFHENYMGTTQNPKSTIKLSDIA